MCSGGETEDGTIYSYCCCCYYYCCDWTHLPTHIFFKFYFIFLFGQSARVYAPLECRI